MKALAVCLMLLAAVSPMAGQSFGSLFFGPIAPTVAGCPTDDPKYTNGARLCAVGTDPSNYAIWVSFNGMAYVQLINNGPVNGAAPIVVTGNQISCPRCVQRSKIVAKPKKISHHRTIPDATDSITARYSYRVADSIIVHDWPSSK